MKFDDVATPGMHEKVWRFNKFSLQVAVDWHTWAIPLWVMAGTLEVKPSTGIGGWLRYKTAAIQIGPFGVGVTLG